ncbi:hypothetical protein I302_105360 [Kwoniella bestiolae CBS 10118]|uniref:Uncharacterized protein n=1 Tax=Kwoniella bestiolae CBS 10118 TaxID=1296100 RepID=A0AAJ8K8S1_9TREE
MNLNGRLLMRNVQRLSILPIQECRYENHHSLLNRKLERWGVKECYSERINYLLDNRFDIQDQFQAILARILSPPHLCDHSSHGPYSWDLSAVPPPKTYTTEIGREYIRYKIPIPILSSSTTRLIIKSETVQNFRPKEDWFLTPQDREARSLEGFLRWFRLILTKTVRGLPRGNGNGNGQTRMIIYLPVELSVLRTVAPRLRTSLGDQIEGMSYSKIFEEIGKWLIGKKGSGFKGKGVKVDVATWAERGECPACGK